MRPLAQTASDRGLAPARPTRAQAAAQPADLNELPRWCKAISPRLSRLPLEACLRSALQAGQGRSVRGVPLWVRDIVPAEGAARLRALVIGGIHADEKASINLAFDWLERAGQDPSDARGVHWRIVPLLNPDGLLRKPATRTNGRGVDLNRNFPTADWERDAQRYWLRRTGKDPRRYPGPRAMSEPETRWLIEQIEQFKPQLIVAIHAPYGLLDFDGPPPPPSKLGSLHLDQIGVYPGSLGNYGGLMLGVPVITVELKNAERVARQETQAIWTDLLRWMDQRMLSSPAWAIEPPPGSDQPR
jgi:protein MpaA